MEFASFEAKIDNRRLFIPYEDGNLMTISGQPVPDKFQDNKFYEVQVTIFFGNGTSEKLSSKITVTPQVSSVDGTTIPRMFAVFLPDNLYKKNIEIVRIKF